MPRWLSIDQAAGYLGLSKSQIYALAQDGRIPASKIGKVWRLDQEDLDSWVRATESIDDFFVDNPADVEDNMCLRDPQREAYLAARDFFEKGGKKAILQMPVGCGKSGEIAILPFGIARGPVLVIAPNLTIRDGLKNTLDITKPARNFWKKCEVLTKQTMATGPYLAVLDGPNANIHDCDDSHFVLTNIQQLASSADRWLPQFGDNYFDLILIDEGHHNAAPSWKKVFERFPNAKVASLTATPFRADRQELEGELIYRYPFKRAMLRGYIKPLQARYVAPEQLVFTYQGDTRSHTLEEVLELKEEEWFSRGVAIAKECNEHIVDASLERLEAMRRTGTQHQLIAVACSIRHAKQIRSLYVERGYESEVIHSNLSDDERKSVLQNLRSGLLDCIVQVQILGEGFDHPNLSIAAIFRPFRSLAPYVQFIGRIMRVIVQGDPNHPDNLGNIVSHIGLNTDFLMEELRQLDRDDQAFFEALMSGEEPDLPESVLSGDGRQRLNPEMAVQREIVSSFLEEGFLNPGDEALVAELLKQAELLGLDTEAVGAAVRGREAAGMRTRAATDPFPVSPQRRRQEARRRLSEEVKTAAKVLLNRLDLGVVGVEIPTRFGGSGSNLTAAVQIMNKRLNDAMGWETGKREKLSTEEIELGIAALDNILKDVTRQVAAKVRKKQKEPDDNGKG